MDARQFALAAIADNAHYEKLWVISLFSVIADNDYPLGWKIIYGKDATDVVTPEGRVTLEGVTPMKPVIEWTDFVTLGPDDHPMFDKETTTTWGTFIFNLWVIWYALGNRYPYVHGATPENPSGLVDMNALNKKIVTLMVSDPADSADKDPKTIYVSDYKRLCEAATRLTGFATVFVPSGTPKSLTAHPKAKAILKQRLEENKDRLHDPAVIAKIQDEQVKLDKEHLKDDPSMGFFLPGKVWHTARKRMFYVHGPESGLDEAATPEFLTNSLTEGWDIKKLPTMINSLRAGSYYRGAMTALGGESVKFFLRIFQNVYISEHDCQSRVGLPYTVDSHSVGGLVGRYEVGNPPIPLTEERLKSLIGKTILLRSPWSCRTPGSDICAICAGDRNASTPYALSANEASIGSTFMGVMMSAAHAKVLSVAELEEDFLT